MNRSGEGSRNGGVAHTVTVLVTGFAVCLTPKIFLVLPAYTDTELLFDDGRTLGVQQA